MAGEKADSVTVWIESLKSGDAEAAQKLWERYIADLIRLARARLGGAPRAVADEEDAALSAFDSFFRGAACGRYPQLADRDDLWRLLVVITERKAIDQAQHERRQKRGGGKVVGLSDPLVADGKGGNVAIVSSPLPSPEYASLVADECQKLLASLSNQILREVALMKLEGFTHDEIAERMGFSLRSVARKVDLIRRKWHHTIGEKQ
jgi:DNA-directed RNA polymerase specialized sigma24 family protein